MLGATRIRCWKRNRSKALDGASLLLKNRALFLPQHINRSSSRCKGESSWLFICAAQFPCQRYWHRSTKSRESVLERMEDCVSGKSRTANKKMTGKLLSIVRNRICPANALVLGESIAINPRSKGDNGRQLMNSDRSEQH